MARSGRRAGALGVLAALVAWTAIGDAAVVPGYLGQWTGFSSPYGVTANVQGTVFVADTWAHVIQRFTAAGDPVGSFSGYGIHADQLAYPVGVATDPSGRVYVADYGNSCVKVFTPEGAFVRQVGQRGQFDGEFSNCGGVAVDRDGNVFAIDLGGGRIEKFDATGHIVWSSAPPYPGFAFLWPAAGIAVDDSGHVFVTDSGNHLIRKFSTNGLYTGSWGGFGSAAGQFNAPVGIAVDHRGGVYVADSKNNRIQVFSTGGLYLGEWGGATDPVYLREPDGVTIAPWGHVYVADTGNNRVVYYGDLQAMESRTELVTSPNPSNAGQAVELLATVTPVDTGGFVRFLVDGAEVANVALDAGTATFSLSGLLHGSHDITASFSGSATRLPSVSDLVHQVVRLAPVRSQVVSTLDPSGYAEPVAFLATVTADPAPFGPPAGNVVFTVDGAPFGAPRLLVGGRATSPATDSLVLGAHAVRAIYLPPDTLRYAPDTSEAIIQEVRPSQPEIVAVRDVPNDQGGRVFLRWHCILDRPGSRLVAGYRVWRRLPAGTPRALPASLGRPGSPAAPDSTSPEDFWEALADLPAAQLVSYGYAAPTTQDSIAGSNPYSTFMVQALTSDPYRSFFSSPDSGYSVDNLAPPAPASFVAQYLSGQVALHWSRSAAPDVASYRLFRGLAPDFIPGESTLIAAQADTGFVDPVTGGQYCYKLAAMDVHGNLGRFAIIPPFGATAALATFLEPVVSGSTVRLSWYLTLDEPLTIGVERRTLAQGWESIGDAEVDGSGYVRFEDTGLLAGMRYGYRLVLRRAAGAIDDAGEGWIDVPVSEADATVSVPNPVIDGTVSVSFVPPPGPRVRVELFDLAGRMVASREVPAGAGRQTVALARSNTLSPGVYLVRVGLPRPVHRRVAVVR
jgi:sugar lactone lactonase YvrE